MVALLLVRQEISVSGSEPSKQTLRVKRVPIARTVGEAQIGPPVIGGTPILDLNFINGYYKVNGVSYAASAVIDHPEYIDGTGLAIPESGSIVSIIGPALAVLLTGNWTAVICWDHFASTQQIVPLVVIGPESDNGVQIERQDFFGGFFLHSEDFAALNFRQVTDVSGPMGDGQHTVALTRVDAEIAQSGDGLPVILNNSINFAILPNTAAFGGQAPGIIGDAITIKCLRVFAPQDNSLLPALSVQSCGIAPVPPVETLAVFSSLTGNFLQVIDLIGPAPMAADSALTSGPDDRRERAIGKLSEWD